VSISLLKIAWDRRIISLSRGYRYIRYRYSEVLLYYAFDWCHNLDPFVIREIQIAEPAICANGNRAFFEVFKSSFFKGFGSASTQVSGVMVGQRISVRSWQSFAFVCDGIGEEESRTFIDLSHWISPWTAFWLILGTLFLALSLGTAFLFCGGFVILMGGLGLLFWGFWSLVKGLLVSWDIL
jgi:hypothetical protein